MDSEDKLKERLKQIQKEYEKKQRKLKKCNRVAKAKEHVKKKLREQASLHNTKHDTANIDVKDTGESKNSENIPSPNNQSVAHSDSSQQSKVYTENCPAVVIVNSNQREAFEKTENVGRRTKVYVTHSIKAKSEAMGKFPDNLCTVAQSSETLEAISGSENSCSQDIFCSPKTASRSLFEDIYKKVVNRDDSSVSGKKGTNQTEKSVGADLTFAPFTVIPLKLNEKENALPSVLDRSRNGACHSDDIDFNSSLNEIQEHSGSGLNFQRKCIKAVNVEKIRVDDNTKETDSLKCPIISDTVSDTALNVAAFDKATSNATVSKTYSIMCKSRSSRENAGHKLVTKNIFAEKKNDVSESVSAVSETPTDSDWTVPSSAEDFINIKSKRRKRRSLSTSRLRQSPRIAELSSQESLSQSNSDHLLGELNLSDQIQKIKLTNKRLVITSIFQCLMDEAKRQKGMEFNLPLHFSVTQPDQYDVKNKIINMTSLETEYGNQDGAEEQTNKRNSYTNAADRFKRSQQNEIEVPVTDTRELDKTELFLHTDIVQLSDSTHTELKEDEIVHKSEGTVETSFSDLQNKSVQICDIYSSQSLQEPCMSPPLFESQADLPKTEHKTDRNVPEEDTHLNSSPEAQGGEMNVGCKASPAGIAAIPEVQEKLHQTVGTILEQKHLLQIPKTDQLITMVMGKREEKLYIVCLCSANLRFYCLGDEDWSCYHTEKLGFSVKKNSGCSITLIPDTSRLCVVLQQRQTDSFRLILYTSCDSVVKMLHVDTLWSRSVVLRPVQDNIFISSHVTDQKTYLTKYTLSESNDIQRQNFEPVCDEITSLCVIRDAEGAMLGLSVAGQLYVWNYKQMSLLTMIDVSDVSLQDMICSQAFQEEGFLFLIVFSGRKSQQAGSVLVVNPQMGTCETLTALKTNNNKWTGFTSAVMFLDEYIIVRETCGTLLLWDIYSGELVTSVKDLSISCVSSSVGTLAVCHRQCIHIYKTVDVGVDLVADRKR